MNQPIDDRFKKIEARQEDFDKRLSEVESRQTEPIRIDRLEIDRGGTQDLLKEANKKLEQIIQAQTDRNEKFGTLQHGQQEILKKQDEHARLLLAHSKSASALQTDVGSLKTGMEGVKADVKAIRESQADFRDALGGQTKRLDRIEETMATKDDIATFKTDIVSMKATQDQILALLQQKPPES